MPCQTILLDGAMGTRLQQLTGNYHNRSPLWNVEKPEMVRQVHQSYLQAGSEILLTNTFSAQAEGEFQSALQCIQNLQGQYRIAGSIGPSTSIEGARILAPQVDFFVLETYSDLKSARVSFESLESFGKPIVVSFAWIYEDGFRLFSGETFSTVLSEIQQWPLFAAGANCNLGTARMAEIGKMLADVGKFDVWIKSNAGQPRQEGGVFIYDQQPDEFAADLKPLLGVVRYLGGCCGAHDRHLSALIRTS